MRIERQQVVRTVGLVFAAIVGLILVGFAVGFLGIFFPVVVSIALLLFVIDAWWHAARY